MTSHLRTRTVYGLYWRFVWMSLLLALAIAVVGAVAVGIIWILDAVWGKSTATELLQTAI